MAVICNTIFPYDQVRPTWTGSVGEVEASDLSAARFFPGRVYDDAADEGFVILGRAENITFVLDGQKNSGAPDYEVQAWIYRSINRRTGRKDGRFELHILND